MKSGSVFVLVTSAAWAISAQAGRPTGQDGREVADQGLVDRDSQPLFFGPPGDHDPSPATNDNHNDATTATPARPTSKATTRTTQAVTTYAQDKDDNKSSTSPPDSTTEHDSDTSTQTSPTDTSTSATSSPTQPSHTKSSPLMPLAYLSPLFLLVLVSLGGWTYSRWYAYKIRREEQRYTIPPVQSSSWAPGPGRPSSTSIFGLSKSRRDAGQPHGKWSFSRSGQWRSGGWGNGWKSLHDLDTVDEERYDINGEKLDPEDPWYAGEVDTVQWQDVELGTGRVDEGTSSVVPEDKHGHEGKKVVFEQDTQRTVNPSRWRNFDMWWSRKNSSNPARPGKIVSQPYVSLPVTEDPFTAPALSPELGVPTAPNWIVPRSTVTSPQLLSPPMQPHLFFHPNSGDRADGIECSCSSDSHTSLCLGSSSSDESSILGDVAEMVSVPEHERWPTIPISATALAQAAAYDGILPSDLREYSSVPEESRTPKAQRGTAPGRTTTIKRSTGRMNLSNGPDGSPTPKRPIRSAMKGSRLLASMAQGPNGLATPRPGLTRTPTKSRVQQRQDQAQRTVNDILQASWSDRLLAASPPPTSIDGMMVAISRPGSPLGAMSSGLDGMVLGSRNPFGG